MTVDVPSAVLLLSYYSLYVLSYSVLAFLFSFAVFARSGFRRKKFAENLVVSKSRCTFALATQKNGSSEVFGDP